MQPLNGRVLVRIANSKYKHVSVNAKSYETDNKGVVLAQAESVPTELVGKTVRWEHLAEQNTIFDGVDDDQQPCKLALIKYEDIAGYED